MKKLFVLIIGVATAVPMFSSFAVAKGKSELMQQLEALKTRTGLDRMRITQEGPTFVIQKAGMMADVMASMTFVANNVDLSDTARVAQVHGAAGFLTDSSNNESMKVGEKVYLIGVAEHDGALRLEFLTTETRDVTIHGTTKPARYKFAVFFRNFPKSLDDMTLEEVQAAIAPYVATEAYLTAQSAAKTKAAEAVANTPKSVKLGMTEAEVVSALGPPKTRVDLGTKVILTYPDLKVVVVDNKVTDVQ